MCGIVGYIGSRDVPSVLVDGLKRLEYRGYDSCGVAIMDSSSPKVIRSVGRIRALEEKIQEVAGGHGLAVRCGIGHTRWATHGRPSEDNAHPHRDCTGRFYVAHNGIIENYLEIKRRLSEKGHRFITATDTEVLPHLIECYYEGDLEKAVRRALCEVEGVYGMVAVCTLETDRIVAARRGPPLVIGIGAGENFIASDIPALLPYTRSMVFLKDGEVAIIGAGGIEIKDAHGGTIRRDPETVSWSAEMAEREGYPHFMLKEIYEQPRAIRDTIAGRITKDDAITLGPELGGLDLRRFERIGIVACGTSHHAGLVGKFFIESLAQIPVDVDYASEFRYREPLINSKTLVIGISQSGETADTLAAMKEARERGARLISICNVVGSQAARQSDGVIYTHAGPEIGVASTKAFTTQLSVLLLFALEMAQVRKSLTKAEIARCAALLRAVPDQLQRVLDGSGGIPALAEKFMNHSSFLYLGRGIHYPIAMEGALKLKEISYIHAEGYTAGEMKHGPIALIDEQMPVVVLAPKDRVYRKTMGNIEEVKVRDGIVIAIATERDSEIQQKADHVIFIPEADPLISPILTTIPLQLFSYYVASLRGRDVDKPRNLAKSVTVE
jgi:glucosamine--fructose-6-phosphate aminotransferase (isomerizing)